MRERVLEARKPDGADHRQHRLATCLSGHSAGLQPECDVVDDGHPRKDALLLEDHRVQRPRASALAIDGEGAAARALETREHPQESRLSATGRAHDRDELAGAHLEVDRRQRLERPTPNRELLSQASDMDLLPHG